MAVDPLEAARDAGLHYASDARPGIRRRRSGRGFAYLDASGTLVRDRAELRRIKRLAVPPAWTDVWISADPLGHLQATGRDARGRKQYCYHERWREVRDADKYGDLVAFARSLPAIRRRTARALAAPGLDREKVVAAAVRLLDLSLIRVGNEEYARANRSFGLTTMRSRHVRVRGPRILFRFRGKSGKEHEVEVVDEHLAKVIRRCEDIPGQDLFSYVSDDGVAHTVGSQDVNAWLRDVSGRDLTAKGFRTWSGTVLMARALADQPHALHGTRGVRKNVLRACEAVASRLGNTPAVCRRSYIHPAIVAAYEDGSLRRAMRRGAVRRRIRGLSADETAALGLLERVPAAPARRAA